MDVSSSDWKEKAIERIDMYLNRGGEGRGDDPELLKEPDLQNTIGVAMNLAMDNPLEWTDDELRRAERNELVYFKGTARKAIDIVVNQIRYVCDGDMEHYVTVLPIELYYEGKLYEVPLFRVQRYFNRPACYVDNVGRSYTSVYDWYWNNKLPPGKMLYPVGLKLKLDCRGNHAAVCFADTPHARPDTIAARTIDMAAVIAATGSSAALLFVTGGLATPLLLTSVGSAIWSTVRAGRQLADKSKHGESLNPINDSESRMLWLGVVANLVSFSTMGASWRLSSLALRGKKISDTLRIFYNVASGTNVVVSGIAIVDSTLFLIEQQHKLTDGDVLMIVVSVAFWTKSAYTYKTASELITHVQNAAFKQLSSELTQQQASELAEFRRQFRGDEQLLREYYRAGQLGISPTVFSQILIDGHMQGQIRLDGAGNLILPGGITFSIKFLSTLPHDIRMNGFYALANLSPEQTASFNDLRSFVNNDALLVTKIYEFGVHYNLNARQSVEHVTNFWRKYVDMNLASRATVVGFVEDSLVIGRAPPIKIVTLPELTLPVVRFIGEQLSRMDAATSRQWFSSFVPVLLNLESHGMLTVCPVTKIVPSGRSVVLLNKELQISIYKLNAIPRDDCKQVFSLIGQLPSTVSGSSLPSDVVKLCVGKYRLRFECQRRECVQWMTKHVQNHDSLRAILGAELQTFEMDRLYTFKSTVSGSKAESYMGKMMSFIAEMNPKNISELVSYGEFAVAYVDTQRAMVAEQLRNKTLKLPHNANGKEWTRQMASETAFKNMDAMKQKFNELLTIVRNNNMAGVEQLSKGLSDQDLVAAIREKNIKFGSDISAAYHIYKHEVGPHDTYITRANEAIRSSGDRYTVTLTQDGDARLINFAHETGSCVLLERDGRVLLCTYIAKKK